MSDSATPPSLEQRMQWLETRMAQLEEARFSAALKPAPARRSDPDPDPAPDPGRARVWVFADSGEGWLGRVGVGLLVVGLILLFKYAVDRGWLTPEMRIAIGLVVGAGLLGAGMFYFLERRRYRQILMAGGIVVLFITGLAAVELYQLISGSFALVFFVAVAGTALTIAARQEESIIASIGAVGAMLPPSFMLTDAVPGAILWAYLAIIIAWTGVLLVLRGWERPLLFAAAVSVVAMFHRVPALLDVQVAAVLAVSACWLCYAALPLVRARILVARAVPPLSSEVLLAVPALVTIGLAFVGVEFVFPDSRAFELSATLDAIGFAAIALWLRPHRSTDTPSRALQWRGETYGVDGYSAAACACVVSLAAAAAAGIDTPWLYFAVAAIAAAAVALKDEVGVELFRPVAHVLYGTLFIAFAMLVDTVARRPAFDSHAIAFALVGVIAAVTALQLKRRDERLVYFIGVYFIAHVLLATELVDVRSAPWLASAAYGVVGSALLIAGLSRRLVSVQRAGMVSLGLLVVRLFLYDLAQVDVGVRIVLFMACGFVFLGLSYLVRSRRFAA